MRIAGILIITFAAAGMAQTPAPKPQMLPDFGVFDSVLYELNGDTAVLTGEVTRPNLKTAAETFVNLISGVDMIDDRIEVLPKSASDDELRSDLYAAIYGKLSNDLYGRAVVKPLRIIVKEGHVTLEGSVNSHDDEVTAKSQAGKVPGVASVTDHLRVLKMERIPE